MCFHEHSILFIIATAINFLDGKEKYCPLTEWVIMVCVVCSLMSCLQSVCDHSLLCLCLCLAPGPRLSGSARRWWVDVSIHTCHSYIQRSHSYTRRDQTYNYFVRLSREWSGPRSPSTPGLCWESLQRMAETSHVRLFLDGHVVHILQPRIPLGNKNNWILVTALSPN